MKGVLLSPNVRNFLGLKKKVLSQERIFRKYGFSISLLMENNHPFKSRFPLFSTQLINFSNIGKETDFVYIRMPEAIDIHFIIKCCRLRKRSKVILEIPTYPFDSERKSLFNLPLQIKNKIWTKFLKYSIDRIVTFSKDLEIFGVPTIPIANGVDVEMINMKKKKFNKQGIRMIAVASLAYWHGYDRLIVAMGQYKKQNGYLDLYFDIVGDYDEELFQEYTMLIQHNDLQEEVRLLGSLDGQELDNAFNDADIAIDSLGRHRSGVYYNSSLKGKEYLARGLPIVSGVETELDAFSFPFYYRVSADESPIDLQKIKEFYFENIIKNNERSEIIVLQIRQFARENFDMMKTMFPVIDYIKR